VKRLAVEAFRGVGQGYFNGLLGATRANDDRAEINNLHANPHQLKELQRN